MFNSYATDGRTDTPSYGHAKTHLRKKKKEEICKRNGKDIFKERKIGEAEKEEETEKDA